MLEIYEKQGIKYFDYKNPDIVVEMIGPDN
jgi:hypothetical protein